MTMPLSFHSPISVEQTKKTFDDDDDDAERTRCKCMNVTSHLCRLRIFDAFLSRRFFLSFFFPLTCLKKGCFILLVVLSNDRIVFIEIGVCIKCVRKCRRNEENTFRQSIYTCIAVVFQPNESMQLFWFQMGRHFERCLWWRSNYFKMTAKHFNDENELKNAKNQRKSFQR